jgi:hypothetical protein
MLTSDGFGNKNAEVGTVSEAGTIRDLRDWLVVERAGQSQARGGCRLRS